MSADKHLCNMFRALAAMLHERDPAALVTALDRFGFAPGDVRFRTTQRGQLWTEILRWPWERSGAVRPMRPIPIAAAERIAKDYGYDQVVIIARRVGAPPEPHGEHVTTYGVDRAHCESAAAQGRALKRFMGWPEEKL